MPAPPSPREPLSRLLSDVAVSVIIAVVVFGAIQWWIAPTEWSGGLPLGEPPPAFELFDSQHQQKVRSSDLMGRPTILNFWASWCVPCRAEMPALERLSRQAGGQLQVLTITADDPLLVRQFLTEGGYTLPCLMDSDGRVSELYGVTSLPRTVILDSQGAVLRDIVGMIDLSVIAETLGTETR